MTSAELLSWGITELQKHKIADSRLEAEILLAHALGLKRPQIISQQTNELGNSCRILFERFINRRCRHEPTAYIVGYQPFMSLDFFVDHSVLIPRPETELLVEEVIKNLTVPDGLIADIGTGSGAIAISLAKQLPNVKIIGIDHSVEALEIAKKNAAHHNISDRCQFLAGDMFSPIKEKIDVIVSNPPYIPSAEIEQLQPEVRDWEPREALDGGKDGLDYIRRLIKEGLEHLKPNGFLMLEFGYGQAPAIKKLAGNSQYEVFNDYAGIPRILKMQS